MLIIVTHIIVGERGRWIGNVPS